MRNPFKKETEDQLEQRVMQEVFALLKRNRVTMNVSLQPMAVMGEQLLRPLIVFNKIKSEPKAKENGTEPAGQ